MRASFSSRSASRLMALASLAALLQPSLAVAQLPTAPRLALPPNRFQAAIDALKIKPAVVKIAAIGTDACKTRALPVYEKGVSPAHPTRPNFAYAEVIGGVKTGLRLIGPLMHEVEKIEYQPTDGPLQTLTLTDKIAPSAACAGVFGAGNGAVSVAIDLPSRTSVLNGQLYFYGYTRTKIKVQVTVQNPRMCDLGEVGMVDCSLLADAPYAGEVNLKIVPPPGLVGAMRITQNAAVVSGSLTVPGTNLLGTRLFSSDPAVTLSGISLSATQATFTAAKPMAAGTSSAAVITPRVPLVRGAGQVAIASADTAVDPAIAARFFTGMMVTFVRPANTPPPPPPPPASPNIDGYDPGNTLYVVGGATDGDVNGNNYSGPVDDSFCQGIGQPGLPPSGAGNLANTREITVPDIRWGVKNNGTSAVTGTFTAELHQRSSNGPVVATYTFTNLAANEVKLAPNYARPDSTNTVAVLSSGPRCYNAGLAQAGWNDNDGWVVVIRGIADSLKRIGN